MTWHTLSSTELLADSARSIAMAVAEAGHLECLRGLAADVLDDDTDSSTQFRVSQDHAHSGDMAKQIDALADRACNRAHDEATRLVSDVLGARIENYLYISEESSRTTLLQPHSLVTRCDPLDGTTNFLNTLMGFCTAVSVDYVGDDLSRARHLAGAIIGGTVDIVWINSTPSRAPNPRVPRGVVYVRVPRLSPEWRQLPTLRATRHPHTFAAVASNAARMSEVRTFRKSAFLHDGRMYNYAGNPAAGALLLGELESAIEPMPTKLHDSVLLLPFALLGGTTYTHDHQLLDVLSHYEVNATNLDPAAELMPPYIATVGTAHSRAGLVLASGS